MAYVYDILVNFNDTNRLVEFFEWSDDDIIEHLKRIPLFRVNSNVIEDFYNSRVVVSKDFLEDIYNLTVSYKNKDNIMYACIFSDSNKAIAVEFNKEGLVICKSSFLLDEEDEILDTAYDMDTCNIDYECVDLFDIDYYLTREEITRKNYLILEFDNLFKDNELDKFNYLYEEVFSTDKLNFNERYNKIIKDIELNYSDKYNELYNIVRLSYSKK